MRRTLLAFDLDDTLAVTKSPIAPSMADLLRRCLELYQVCIISGGAFSQFDLQVIQRLEATPRQLAALHLMPTSGTRYYRFDQDSSAWTQQYAEDLTADEKAAAVAVLQESAQQLGMWEASPFGDVIEDRGSQITFSALGQQAPPERKYAWDPDGSKKAKLRSLVAERLPDLEVRAGGSTSIDVTRRGIDKAHGIGRIMELLGLVAPDVLFFGDQLQEGGNDHAVLSLGVDAISVRDCRDTELALKAVVAVTS